jgi:hypothetical protein
MGNLGNILHGWCVVDFDRGACSEKCLHAQVLLRPFGRSNATARGPAMPAQPGSEVFGVSEVRIYRCWNQIVPRRCLFAWGVFTGQDDSYRKEWVRVDSANWPAAAFGGCPRL